MPQPDDRLAYVPLDIAVEWVLSLAAERFPRIRDSTLRDFISLLTYTAGPGGMLSLAELHHMVDNFSMALAEGDVRLLAQPRGLRVRRVVDVQEFVESRFYMGQRGYIRPRIMEELWRLFHGEHHEDRLEVVLGGGIGWGKSFMSEMGMGYMLYKLSCYHSPQIEFGLAPGSSIYFIMQSIKESLAQKVLFGQFGQRLRRSEYFSRYFPLDPSIRSELRFPHDITIMPLSSSDTSALGLNVFGGCFPGNQEYVLGDGSLARLGDCRTESVLTVKSPEGSPLVGVAHQVKSIPTGYKELLRIHLSNGVTIDCTPDQRFKGADGEWVRADNLAGLCALFVYSYVSSVPRPVICVRVERLGVVVPVYDLELVPETNTFFVKAGSGFLLAHNCLDELNFMSRVIRPSTSRLTGEVEYDQAEKLHSTIIRRMKSRFQVRGRVPGKLFLISSANYPDDFIDRKIKEAERDILETGHSNIFVVRMAQWDSLPPGRLSEETFFVEVGDASRSSRILDSMEDALDPESVISVPVDYLSDFRRDLEAAIRDLAGIPIGGTGAFIRKRETIETAATRHALLYEGKQLFIHDTVDLSAWQGRLPDLIDMDYFQFMSGLEGGLFIHVDLALSNDSGGLGAGRFAGYEHVGKSIDWDEETDSYREAEPGKRPRVIMDGILEIVPPRVDEIDINLIGDLIEALNSRVLIEVVTADSFQSAALLQRMRRLRNLAGKRIRSGMLSVDRSIGPYTEVKQALRDERLLYPDVPKLKKELRELVLDQRRLKVDHPVGGSKDVSDVVAGVTYLVNARYSNRDLRKSSARLLSGIDTPGSINPPVKYPDLPEKMPAEASRGANRRIH